MSFVPVVIEQSSRGERSFDIFSRLLRERIIFLGSEIDDDVANSIAVAINIHKKNTTGIRRYFLIPFLKKHFVETEKNVIILNW